MYIRHCVKCGCAMKEDVCICPFCGEAQPLETEETKKNDRKKKQNKWAWIVGVIAGVIGAIIFANDFGGAILVGLGVGYIGSLVTVIGFDLYYSDPNKKDKE